jgi:hypothetical protein
MWIIRAYNPIDDEMAYEHKLDARLTPRDLERLLEYVPTKFGSTPLSEREVDKLARHLSFPIVKGLAYFLDFEADSSSVGRASRPREAATA